MLRISLTLKLAIICVQVNEPSIVQDITPIDSPVVAETAHIQKQHIPLRDFSQVWHVQSSNLCVSQRQHKIISLCCWYLILTTNNDQAWEGDV